MLISTINLPIELLNKIPTRTFASYVCAMGDCRMFFVYCALVAVVSGANILAIFPAPLSSHQSVYRTIWMELLNRGHRVTVVTPNPHHNYAHENLTQIGLEFSHKLAFEDHNLQEILSVEKNLLVLTYHVYTICENLTEEQIKSPGVQKLIRSKERFDLLVVETFMPAWYAFSALFDCPMIGISSLDAPPRLLSSVGNPTHPYIYPDFNLPFGSELTFYESFISVIYSFYFSSLNEYVIFPRYQRMIEKYVGRRLPDLLELEKKMSMLFVNVIPAFFKRRPNVPAIVELNGLHLQPQKNMSKDLQEYLDSGEEGVIYFSLGSTFRSNFITDSKRKIILDALAELPYRVLWKFESTLKNKPENVRIMSWFPQQDVLRHRNVKLFISQGGVQSIEEAIAYNVPVLGMPQFADQYYNVKRLEYLGLGKEISYETLTKEEFKNAIFEMMGNNTKYRSRLREFSELANDQPVKSLDKAMFWIEYVIRHKGAELLRSPVIDMPFYKFYLLDVIALLVLGFALICYLYVKLLRCIFTYCSTSGRLKWKNKVE